MIKLWYREGFFAKYNFYGIPANINTKPKDYISRNQKYFIVEELIGEYELPFIFYILYI